MDTLINEFAWIIVAGWGNWLALLGVVICVVTALQRRMDGIIRIPILLFFGISTVAVAVVTYNTETYRQTAEALAEKAPNHPVLEDVRAFEKKRDWRAAVLFAKRWRDFRYGEDLEDLKATAIQQDSPLREAITEATEDSALSEEAYQGFRRALQE